VTLDDAGEFGQQALSTIICEGDAIGAVILYEKDEKSRMTETESKLAIAAAGFLGKQMEQ
jgi:AbrB family transcriptional regulator (stage V sporulation protein T)